jgi:PAS domain S-box-containing protein
MPNHPKDETFRFFVEQIKDHAVFKIGPDGKVLTWNEGVRRVFGYDEAEWVGMPSDEAFTPEDRANGVPADELREAAERGYATDDRWMLRKGGERFWASGISSRLVDESGALLGFAKVVRDLTGTKRTEEALRAGEERLRLALEAAQMGAFRKAGGELEIDENARRMLGLSSAEAIGMGELLAGVHPDDRERVAAAFDRAESRSEALRVELRWLTAGAAPRWLAISGRCMVPVGRPRYLIGTLLDITDRKRAERRLIEAQRMDAVGQLAGGVAHEINNMLTAILGFTDLMLRDPSIGGSHRGDLEHIHLAATRAAKITSQLLAFGRRQVLKPERLDLSAQVRELEPVLQHVLGADKVLEAHYDAWLPPVLIDPGQLEQVIVDVVLNARDALGPRGRVRIRTYAEQVSVATRASLRGARIVGRAAVLSIEDDGCGMDEQTRARAFEPFFTTKPVGEGTGLGLSTVLGIVQQSGGAVRLVALDRGTRVEIFFPEASGPERADDAEASRRPTVLLVEDEAMVRHVTARYLEAAGYRCVEAENGVDALERLRSSPERVDLVLTDLVMPEMGGRELAEAVARTGRVVPVIFLTGYSHDEAVQQGVAPPGLPIVQKPFAPDELIARVQAVLEERDRTI